MHGKNMEVKEESCRKINDLKIYAFKFSETNGFFEINDLRSLFEVTFGPVFIASTKESLSEENYER